MKHEHHQQRRAAASQTSAKYDENPAASEPGGREVAERKSTVVRKVSGLLPNALLT